MIVFVPFRRDTTSLCEFLQSYNIDVDDESGDDDVDVVYRVSRRNG